MLVPRAHVCAAERLGRALDNNCGIRGLGSCNMPAVSLQTKLERWRLKSTLQANCSQRLWRRRGVPPCAGPHLPPGKHFPFGGSPTMRTCGCGRAPQPLTRPQRPRRLPRLRAQQQMVDNRELLVGDCLTLVGFCLYKQIMAIIALPSFPGWLEPLHFNVLRFEEFLSFSATICGTWVAVAMLMEGYKMSATSDLPTAAWRTVLIWLISQPVAAAQLVLLTAVEGKALVGDGDFASVLPLAASGPGEPFITTAGVLGLMAVWRCFYTVYLDFWNVRSFSGARLDRTRDAAAFVEALSTTFFVSIASCIVLKYLSGAGWFEGGRLDFLP